MLTYFHASPNEYVVIFTPNASGALRLIGESYPFSTEGRYLLTFDNHNSVNGIREFARAKGASVSYVPLVPPDLCVNETYLHRMLAQARSGQSNLFAYPAQSNVSGVQHPLDWIAYAQEQGWDVLVDCAAFVPSNRLDLSVWHPDFVPLSFYKMLGYLTGVGCLLARRSALAKLRRPWFAGGTITLSSASSHIGHGMSALTFDVIRCYLEYRNYRVRHVINFTDIDDKIIHRARSEQTDWCTLTERYIHQYLVL